MAKHGICLPPNMQGLTDEQIVDLKLNDEWQSKCVPSGGYRDCKDAVGRRSGKAPLENMAEILDRTRQEAKAQVSKVFGLFQLAVLFGTGRFHCKSTQMRFSWKVLQFPV